MVAPNLGASFAGGGGSSVAANVAQAMLETNMDVTLLAFSGYSNETLDMLHGTGLSSYSKSLSSEYAFKRGFGNRGAQKVARSEIASLILIGYHYFMSTKIRRMEPNIVWFNDDVPKFCEKRLEDYHSVQYVNFAFRTRLKVQIDEQWESYNTNGRLSKTLGDRNPRLIKLLVGDKALGCEVVIANSSVTCKYIRETAKDVQPLIVYPPVNIECYADAEKENQVAAIGAFRPNKRFGDIIRALSLSRRKDLKLVIVGLSDDDDYFAYLVNLVEKLGMQDRVRLVPNASRRFLNKVLAESRMILSAARFEPFGISVVEGMANGCVPVVYAGEDSGPWVDIIQRGKYGHGFHDINDLSEILSSSSNRVEEATVSEFKKRACQFSSLIFRDRIKKLISGRV